MRLEFLNKHSEWILVEPQMKSPSTIQEKTKINQEEKEKNRDITTPVEVNRFN